MRDGRVAILHLIKGLGIGGAEKLISEGSRFWDRDTFHYEVAYVLPWKDQLVDDLRGRDVPVHMIGGPKGIDARTGPRLRRLIRAQGIDLVHAHLPSAGILARVFSPVPVVYTEHNMPRSYRLPTRVANRATYRRNRSVIAVSDAVADELKAYPGPDPIVIENGVHVSASPDARERVRQELELPDGTALIVHVGNIRPGKGHENLIEAARHLNDGTVVVSIGVEKHAGDLDRLRRRAEDAGVAERVRFLGRRADALDFIAAADVYVNPSDHEGLPVTILEAMTLGTPVVATRVGGVAKLITDGVSGWLVEPGAPEALARALDDALGDRMRSERIATAARAYVETHHSLGAQVARVEELYTRTTEAPCGHLRGSQR